MVDDIKTLGLTGQNKATMDEVVEKVGFGLGMDAAKLAFALALNRGVEHTRIEGVTTVWAVGNFDEGGDIKALIENLLPDVESPYRTLESLINIGFGLLEEEMRTNPNMSIEKLLNQET